MISSRTIVAVLAGVVSATLHLAVLNPSLLSVLLFYLTPLPLFIAGLGWGYRCAVLAGLLAAALLAGFLGFEAAVFFIAGSAIAPALLSWLAAHNGPAAGGRSLEGEACENGVIWYPEGRLMLWSAGLAGVLMSVVILMTAADATELSRLIREKATQVLALTPQQLADERLQHMLDMLVSIVPLLSTSLFLLATMANFWLAAKALKLSGRSPRPWAPFAALAFPRSAALALAVAMGAAMLPGTPGFIGALFTSALATAYTIKGLAVIHYFTQNMTRRPLVLAVVYGVLFIFWWAMAPLIILALAEQLWGLRARVRFNADRT